MLTILRHLLAILMLPFIVVIVVPAWLAGGFLPSSPAWNTGPAVMWLSGAAGLVLMLIGLALFCWCVGLFVSVGQGTLAPWDPTRNLVALGPYRYVRNPMITSVGLLLIGQALLRASWIVGAWAGVFLVINHVYFIWLEEPGLERRFGEAYRVYKANVPRWIPRLESAKR